MEDAGNVRVAIKHAAADASDFGATCAIRHTVQRNSGEHRLPACRFRQLAEILRQESANQSLVTHHFSLVGYGLGRGGGVGRGLGVGVGRGVSVAVAVGVGVAVAVAVAVAVGVNVAVAVPVGVGVGVNVAVGLGVGVPPVCTSKKPMSMRPFTTRAKPGPR